MSAPILLDATQVDPEQLDTFLSRLYPPPKSTFLKAHGEWLHRSNTSRLVVQVDGQIAAYCALIPARIWAAGKVCSAFWWVNLIVAPEYRGRGLQTLVDSHLREMSDLLLGFPNELAGRIHRKHGWEIREDAQVLLLPLRPSQVKSIRNVQGIRGKLLQFGALTLDPLAAFWRALLFFRRTPLARRLDACDGRVFSDIFLHALNDQVCTAWRDESYFDWRYGRAPYAGELRYYLAGTTAPTHYLIARHLARSGGSNCVRILDVFGDFNDTMAIHNLLTLAIQDAISNHASQVTLAASNSQLKRCARRLGFVFSTPFRFCWWSRSAELVSAFRGGNYWTVSDSDNDEPD